MHRKGYLLNDMYYYDTSRSCISSSGSTMGFNIFCMYAQSQTLYLLCFPVACSFYSALPSVHLVDRTE